MPAGSSKEREPERQEGEPDCCATNRAAHLEVFSERKIWWTWSGSNRRPLPCHGSALPAAPQAHCFGDTTSFLRGTSIILAEWSKIVNARDRPGVEKQQPAPADRIGERGGNREIEDVCQGG